MTTVGMRWRLSNPEECARFMAALRPRIRFEIQLPDQDCDRQPFPQLAHVAQFRSLFSELCGGDAPPVAGPGTYHPEGESAVSENTFELKTYLPEIVTKDLKKRLLVAILEFGHSTRQELVLVAVGVFAFRFRFMVRAQENGDVVPAAKVA